MDTDGASVGEEVCVRCGEVARCVELLGVVEPGASCCTVLLSVEH